MTTNEKISSDINIKIANWLKHEHIYEEIWMNPITYQNYWIDFLHDRNQQVWIIDELVKRGYRVDIYFSEHGADVRIWHNDSHVDISITSDKIDDSAFLNAVEQIIDMEEIK